MKNIFIKMKFNVWRILKKNLLLEPIYAVILNLTKIDK